MPNRKMMEASAQRRFKMRPQAKRAYRRYGAQTHALIRQLGSHTQIEHDQAFDRLARMGEFIVDDLLTALADPTLNPVAADEIVSLLGTTGDERAWEPVWQFLQANQGDPERVSIAAMCLAGLGDDRSLPYLRNGLEANDEERVANSATAMSMVGQMEDLPRLRQAHRRHRASREIRLGVANAVLTIVGEADQRTFNRTLDEIQSSFADRDLWADIWAILESEFGSKRHTIH
jgi:hypothetical protein